MIRIFTLIMATIFALTSFAQNFEGKIVYRNTYKSKIPGVTDEQLTAMMGPEQVYYIKNGDYKSVMNGTLIEWQLYINNENKLYNKMANSEMLMWSDGAVNQDEILKVKINKDATEVLGYKCHEVILECKSGVQKYYFNSNISVDPKQFVHHKYGNWYDYIALARALPLKIVVKNPQFSMESIATEVKSMELEKAFFELPKNTQTMKSPD